MDLNAGDLTKIMLGAFSRRLIVNAILVSTTTVMLYDWLLILPLEVKHIWRAPWKWTEVFYLLIRYIPFVNIALMLHTHFASSAPIESCKIVVQSVCWLLVIEVNLVEIVLAVRTYAIWNRDRRVGIGLALLLGLCQVPHAIVLKRFIQTFEYIQNLYPKLYQGCLFISAGRLIVINWVIFSMMEGVVLILMIISALKTYRSRHTSYLARVIYMDGILFYVYSFCVTLVNIVITMLLPIEFIGVGSGTESVLHSILACRLIIGIREARESSEGKPGTFEFPGMPGDDVVALNRCRLPGRSSWVDLEACAGPSNV